ncbi:MAG TPA: hypothetical protein V6C58_22075 [Allocoleopsis sp.]
MPRISPTKKDKISEQIIHYLFSIAPASIYTAEISKEIARDEEFVKSLMLELTKKKLVVQVNKNNKGKIYVKRQRWRLSNEAYEIYKQRQHFSKFIISEPNAKHNTHSL